MLMSHVEGYREDAGQEKGSRLFREQLPFDVKWNYL